MFIYIHILYYYKLFFRLTDSDYIFGIFKLNLTYCICKLLGNENIYKMVHGNNYMLRVDLEAADGEQKYATYYTFTIADEIDLYRLNIEGYCGDAGKK